MSAEMVTRESFSLSPIVGDKRVVILTGWAGAGKGKLFDILLRGLADQLPSVAAIVNEKSRESALIDTMRLSKEARTKAVAGCACCVSIDQIVSSVAEFAGSGAKLTIVEQSPLSRTSRVVQRLKAQAFTPFVVAVLNPNQIEGAKSYIYSQIRAAHAVVLTHVGSDNPNAEKDIAATKALISDLTKDLPCAPAVFVSRDVKDLKAIEQLWSSIQSQKPNLTVSASGDLEAQQEASRLRDLDNFSEVFVHVYPGLTDSQIADALRDLKSNPEKQSSGVTLQEPVKVIRAKGTIANEDVDVTVDARGFHVTRLSRNPAAPRFDGQDFLLIRTLDPKLFSSWGSLYQTIGTQELDQMAVNRITSLYPPREQIREDLKKGKLTVVLGADTLLWDLIDNLPFFKSIRDEGRKTAAGHAFLGLLSAFLRVRENLLEEVSGANEASPQTLLDVAFVTAKVMSHPYLQPLLTNSQSPIFEAADKIERRGPAKLIVSALARVESLSINDRARLTGDDAKWLQIIFKRGREKQQIGRDDAVKAIENLRAKAQSSQSHSWSAYLPDLERALIG